MSRRSATRTACALAALLSCVSGRAAGQPAPRMVASDPRPGFLARYDFSASMEALSEHEEDFYWDGDLGAGLDVYDYGRGRVRLGVNIEAIMGNTLQPFDPWQINYTFDVLGTLRQGSTEWGAAFRHVSRHLGDRRKDFGIAWNDLGLSVVHTRSGGRWTWQVQAYALGTVLHDFVDYAGDFGGDLLVRRAGKGRLSLIASAGGHARPVTDTPIERGTQYGARAEAGVRLAGQAATVEIVGGFERRIDADAFALEPSQWAFAGLRIVNR